MKQEHPTVDFSMLYRCLLIGLDDATFGVCKEHVRPLEAVRAINAREACTKMSEILPLVVVLPDDALQGDVSEVSDVARACGAEVIAVELPVERAKFGRQILDALQKGEARRVLR